jgi:hypothetical protein
LPVLLGLGEVTELLKTYIRTYTDWAQSSRVLDMTLIFFALHNVAVAEFEGVLTMVNHITTTTREV